MASIFSGSSGRRTAQQNYGLLQNAQGQIDQRLDLGQQNAIQTIGAYEPLSLSALGQGYDQARGSYGEGIGAIQNLDLSGFRPYTEQGGKAFGLLADSYGVNGAGGNQNAVGAFQASPGYQWNVDQAADTAARHAAAAGIAGSGNTLAAISDRAGQMANQEYGNWRSGLRDLGQTGFAATGAQAGLQARQGEAIAGLQKGIGDLFANQGTGSANIYQQNAGRIAGLYGDTATAGVNALANTTAGLVNQNTLGQQAGQNASANTWNMGMNLANLLASVGGRFLPKAV